jgi:hypothetical protein
MARALPRIASVGVFVVVLIAHYVVQFATWASHEGNVAPGYAGGRPVWWEAASFPIFWLASGAMSNSHFDVLLWINSGVWAAAATIILFVGWRVVRRAT